MSCKGIFKGVQAVRPSGYNIIETGFKENVLVYKGTGKGVQEGQVRG